MIHLVSEPSPVKPNGRKVNIYFNDNQGIKSCSALCIMCLSRGADNVYSNIGSVLRSHDCRLKMH